MVTYKNRAFVFYWCLYNKRILHGRLEIRNFLSPSGHVISILYLLYCSFTVKQSSSRLDKKANVIVETCQNLCQNGIAYVSGLLPFFNEFQKTCAEMPTYGDLKSGDFIHPVSPPLPPRSTYPLPLPSSPPP